MTAPPMASRAIPGLDVVFVTLISNVADPALSDTG